LIQATAPFLARRPEGQRPAAGTRARDGENGKRPDLGKTPPTPPPISVTPYPSLLRQFFP